MAIVNYHCPIAIKPEIEELIEKLKAKGVWKDNGDE